MNIFYWQCSCKKGCPLAWVVNWCKNDSKWYLAQAGETHEPKYGSLMTKTPGQKPKERYGIALNIKLLYDEWLRRKESTTACDLRNKLIMKRFKNCGLALEERNAKYCFSEQLISSFFLIYFV